MNGQSQKVYYIMVKINKLPISVIGITQNDHVRIKILLIWDISSKRKELESP